MFAKFRAAAASFFACIFGKITWASPSWMRSLKKHPVIFTTGCSVLLALLATTIYTWTWYSHLPKPALVSVKITPPGITPLTDNELIPDKLILTFGMEGEEFTPKSVAPLQQIDKVVKEGITLKPNWPGSWSWLGDNTLVFTPEKDWPADKTFRIIFDKKLLAPSVDMEKMTYSFHTEPFTATLHDFHFYQDPVDPDTRQAVATIDFNFPVDTNTVLSHLSMNWQSLNKEKSDKKAPLFTVTYDPFKRQAFVRTENLLLPALSEYLVLQVKKGIQSTDKHATGADIVQNTLIPNKTSYLKVNTLAASIIRNPQDRPEQILNLEFTVGVTDAALNQSLRVYLLPENYPATAIEKEKPQYQWSNPGEVTEAILKLATPLDLHPLPTDRNYATLHSYRFKAHTPRYMYIKLDKGLKGFGGFSLDTAWSAVVKVPELPREISFLHKGALLALGGEQKLSVLVRGVEAVKFEYARVLPDNINQLITQTQGDFNNPTFINQSFNQYNISEIFSHIQPFDASDLSKQQYTALDFSKYMSQRENASARGLFLLQATAWDMTNNSALDIRNNRLILVTDMAMVVKDNQNGSHDVFVQSITEGKPVLNAVVSILGKNGLPVLSRITDAQGRAHFPSLKDFVEERQPVVWLANLGNDVSFIPYSNYHRELNFSRFDTGGRYIFNDQAGVSAYVFSDRGIYRPGDTVHMGFVVKQGYVQSQPAGMPLQVRITDPRGTTVFDQKVTVDGTGLLALDFSTADTSPTGQYFINTYIVKDNVPDGWIGSASFNVNEFQPDRLRMAVAFSKDSPVGWMKPEAVKATVDLWNLYGTPAANRKVGAKILLSPQAIHFDKYAEYTFADPLLDPKKLPRVFTDNLTSLITDETGQATFDLQLNRFEKATYRLTFLAEGFEADGGRSVMAQASALVSPLPWLLGYKPDGDLQYIHHNTARSLHLIAIDPSLNLINTQGLKTQLLSLQPITTLVKKPDGTFHYQSLSHAKVLETKPLNLTDKGLDYSLPTQEVGDYALVVLNEENMELSRIPFSVVGESQKSLFKNAQLQIKLDKTEYLPGENITLQITAPYTGAGLITLERDKVYASQWFKTDATNSMQTIQIPADFEGDGYVNVSFARDWDSSDLFISPLSYAVVPFTMNHQNHDLAIQLNIPPVSKPGEDLTIQYKSSVSGKIIVFAVDEGILQVSRFKTPDPLAFFFQKPALQVITQQTVDLILPKFLQERELSSVGGDGGEEALAKHLNPFKRKTDLPVVYWSGIVDTDNNARDLSFKVPDYFNGKLRVMAVGVTEKMVGSAQQSTDIRGDFIINPNVPLFVTPGDTFEVTAGIANNVQGSGDLTVNISMQITPDLELLDDSGQALVIPEGKEKTVRFKVKARQVSSSAQISIQASAANKSSAMHSSLSIRPSTTYTSTLVSGSSNAAEKTVNINANVYPQYRKAEAAVSLNPLILITGLQHFLVNFPYGCTEQLTSQAWSWLAMTNQSWSGVDAQKIQDKVMEIYGMLAQRQMSSGGFSYWPGLGPNDGNDFASVYAMHFLTEARSQGYQFSPDVYANGIMYLKNLVMNNQRDAEMARLQAYAIYVLTRNEIVTTNYLTNLQAYLDTDTAKAWEKSIIGAYIAASHQLLHNEKEAARLVALYQSNKKNTDTTDFYNPAIADAQYLYLLAKHFPDQLSSRGEALIQTLVVAMNTEVMNTTLSGYASLALSVYKNAYAGMQPPAITAIMTDKQEKNLTNNNNALEKVDLDPGVAQVRFNKKQSLTGTWFYQVMQSAFDKTPPVTAFSQGLEISRDYQDEQGNSLTTVQVGDEITVHIHFRAENDEMLTNIALVDLLPGGFEVVRDSVKKDGLDYVDIREDRVVFFTTVETQATEIVYRIKATNAGVYVVPAIFAESMYNPGIKANGVAGSIAVEP